MKINVIALSLMYSGGFRMEIFSYSAMFTVHPLYMRLRPRCLGEDATATCENPSTRG